MLPVVKVRLWILPRQATEVSSFIGDLFMSALKMIIVPLIVSSIIAGIGALGGVKGLWEIGREDLRFLCIDLIVRHSRRFDFGESY